jgi:NADH:ubiquinone oxidoreductase subunit 2 (subunit N)
MIMVACCISLIGIPLTVGCFGKYFLIQPALADGRIILTVILVLNAAISAGYYLRILMAMYLKEPRTEAGVGASATVSETVCTPERCMKTVPLVLAGVLSAGGSIFLGCVIPATSLLRTGTGACTQVLPEHYLKTIGDLNANADTPVAAPAVAQQQ